MKMEEQDNGDLIITFSPTELENLGWKEEDTFNVIVNEDGTLTLEKLTEKNQDTISYKDLEVLKEEELCS